MKVIERFKKPSGLYIRFSDLRKYLAWLIEQGTEEEASVLQRLDEALLATVIHRETHDDVAE